MCQKKKKVATLASVLVLTVERNLAHSCYIFQFVACVESGQFDCKYPQLASTDAQTVSAWRGGFFFFYIKEANVPIKAHFYNYGYQIWITSNDGGKTDKV